MLALYDVFADAKTTVCIDCNLAAALVDEDAPDAEHRCVFCKQSYDSGGLTNRDFI